MLSPKVLLLNIVTKVEFYTARSQAQRYAHVVPALVPATQEI